ncbi:MAG TPA: hypothetical protein VMF13_04020, partial [Luteitalea sp.]|nr:hypothetical protein [Luteitalea sp.]
MRHAPDPDRGYPRPQLERDSWISLNGTWDFAFGDVRRAWPSSVQWDRRIRVPFSPEAPLSGIGDTGFHPVCWYRRTFETPDLHPGERLLLHFGAVDYVGVVWINGRPAGRHTGGYVPWTVDITELLEHGPTQTLVLRADDDPTDLAKPRG